MKTIIITGGIATGKSTVCRFVLDETPGAVLFDCDRAVHELLTSRAIKDRLETEFGDRILSPEAEIDRSKLGAIVFADADARGTLERILHPVVRERGLAAREKAAAAGETTLFLADVPLYYQVEFPLDADEVWVVAATRDSQRQRLHARLGSNTNAGHVDALLDSQMPVEEKVARGDRIIWNEGSREQTEAQVRLALAALKCNC